MSQSRCFTLNNESRTLSSLFATSLSSTPTRIAVPALCIDIVHLRLNYLRPIFSFHVSCLFSLDTSLILPLSILVGLVLVANQIVE